VPLGLLAGALLLAGEAKNGSGALPRYQLASAGFFVYGTSVSGSQRPRLRLAFNHRTRLTDEMSPSGISPVS
jgi:hypothetical protein